MEDAVEGVGKDGSLKAQERVQCSFIASLHVCLPMEKGKINKYVKY